jgi:hypothetical protein
MIKVKSLFDLFGLNFNENVFKAFWSKISRILNTWYYSSEDNHDFKKFWTHYLYDGYFTWSFDEKFLIKSVLSLPLSSSDAERGCFDYINLK